MLKFSLVFAAALIGVFAVSSLVPTASGQQKGDGKQKGGGPPQGPPPPMPAILRNYQPVTAERLLKPEDGNWLMIRRTYDGWGYSPLDQITPANVGTLRPVWVFSTNDLKPHESAPLVNNG